MTDLLFEIFSGAVMVFGIMFVVFVTFALLVAILENVPGTWRSLKSRWRSQ